MPVNATPSGSVFRCYRLATRVAAPILRLMLRRRVKRGKEIAARLPERHGVETGPRPAGRLIWVHAASVGETICVMPVVAQLPPDISVLFTTGTVTSAQLLDRWVQDQGLAARVRHRFVPLDVPRWIGRFLDHWQPEAAVFVESELWPNTLAACRRRGVKLALVNARMSSRSAAGWLRVPRLARRIVRSFDWIQPRSEADEQRWRTLGAENLILRGDLKFAAPPLPVDEAELHRLQALLAGRPIWLAASTQIGEDEIVAEAHRTLVAYWPDLLTIIVPRHPARGEALQTAHGWPRRSSGQHPAIGDGLWIADTIGELGLWYRLCKIVFIGKSLLAPGGGQNPLEAARLGCALCAGPFTGNFDQAIGTLHEASALESVSNAGDLATWVSRLLYDHAQCEEIGQSAMRVASAADHLPAAIAEALNGLKSSFFVK